MILTASRWIDTPASELLDRIQSPKKWSTWLTGVDVTKARKRSVELVIAGPQPFSLSLAVRPRENGVDVELTEGEVTQFISTVVVTEEQGKSNVQLRIEWVPLVTIPSVLVNELRQLPEEWLGNLA